MRRLAVNLAHAAGGLSLREVEIQTGVNNNTVSRILQGRVVPDVLTLARLEAGLHVRLWESPLT